METSGNDVSYMLPARPLGKIRWFGLLLVAFGVLFVSAPARSLVEILQRLAAGNHDAGNWFFVLFMIPFIAAGLFPMWLGLLAICGRCRVDWREHRLSVVDCVGLFRWRRRLPKSPVRKFTVKFGGAKVNDKPVTTGPLADLGMLAAEYDQGKPRIVVLGYPRDWLQTLAQDLSSRVGASSASAAAPEVELVDARENQPQYADVTEKPADSRVSLERRANGLRFEIPPAGLRKGSQGSLGFGIVWCLFMAVFTGFSIFAQTKDSNGGPLVFWIFIPVFWLIGLALLAGAINMGRRRATLLVESSGLSVTQIGLFGTKRREWRRGDIAAIRADASGMAVNDVPIIELQIHPVIGKKAGFFAGRADQELRWMATELRLAMNVPARNG